MRKVLSFVLVLSLVLGSLGMAFAAAPSDVVGKDCEEAVSVLTQLGVVKGYPDGSYKPGNIVTRAEMAVIVISALGLQDYAVGKSSFSDMAGYDWAQGYVAYAESLGIIAGYPDGTFKPGKTVSYDEAATMLVAALGYNADSLVGTWPANFVTKAKTLGILDGIKAGAAGANRGDIAIMAYQTLDQNIGKTDKDGVWTATVLKAGPPAVYDNMLGRLDAEEANGGAAFVVMGDEDSLINLKPYIGAYVTAYESDGDIIAIKEMKSVFLTGDFDGTTPANDIATDVAGVSLFNNKVIDIDGTDYTVKAFYDDWANTGAADTNDPVYFRNGKEIPLGFTVKAESDYTLAAKVSGTKITKIYSISEWTPDQNKKVTANDLKAIDADTPKLLTETFVLDDNDEIDLDAFDLVGVSSLDDIKKGNIVYVYSNADGIAKIEVGTKIVTGEVTKIKGSNYTIDGTAYKFTDKAIYNNAMAAGTRPAVGDEIEAYLDQAGKIFFYEEVSGDADMYAVVLKTGDGTEGAGLNDKDTKIELFLNDGSVKVFTVDSDEYDTLATAGVLNDDGSSDRTVDWAVVTGDVVKYDVNEDGEINDMEFVVDHTDTVAPFTAAIVADLRYDGSEDLTKNGYFDGLAVTSDAVIFTYDSFTSKKDDYGVTTRASLLDSTINGAWYVVDDNEIVFMYIDADSTTSTDVYGIFVDFATVSSTSPKYEVDLIVDGVEKTYAMKKDVSAYATTDLYVLSFALDGTTLDDIVAVTVANWDNMRETTAADAVVSGQTVKGTMEIDGAGGGVANTVITLDSNVIVYVYNGDDSAYEVGDINDIEGVTGVLFYDFNEDKVFDIVLVP